MRTPTGFKIDDPAWALLQTEISYWGITDNDGNVAGTTIRCTGLATEPPYDNHALKLISGPCAGQVRDIVTHPAGTDTLTAASAFTNVTGAAQQILAGTRFVIISKMPAIAEIHGVFTVLPSAPNIIEPDTTQDLSLSISTVEGIPAAADLTAGTITITRVRAGAETVIVAAAACAVANGRIFYDYTFPAASWQSGDEYKAVFSGQQVTVGATTYALSDIRVKGVVADWAAITALVNQLLAWDTAVSGTLLATGGVDQILLTAETYDFELYLDIDLVNMAGGDTTVISVNKRVDGVNLRLADQQTFNNAQTILVYSIGPVWGNADNDIQVTLQQTAGVMRNYPWRWNIKRRVTG